MKRSLYILAVTLVLAVIVHLLIIVLIPSFATKDAWAKLEAAGEPWKFLEVYRPGQSSGALPIIDPNFGVAACRYDLTESPLLVTARGQLAYWSVAIFDRKGRNIYSFNDRTANDRQLFLIVVDPVQMAQLRKNPTEESTSAVLVESSNPQGFVLIRAFQPDSSWEEEVSMFLKGAKCEKYSPAIEDT